MGTFFDLVVCREVGEKVPTSGGLDARQARMVLSVLNLSPSERSLFFDKKELILRMARRRLCYL